jgi:hypothetical protein
VALIAIWKSKALPKLKVFSWLLMLDRLNTRDLMVRKQWHLDTGSACAICNNSTLETRERLFFECDFAQQCWDSLDIQWDMARPLSDRFELARSLFRGPCFMEIMACSAWNIWKLRNDLIFQGIPVSINRWKVRFQSDLMLHQYKVKAAMIQPLIDWLLTIFV